jgi:hypothetical protein
MKAQLPIVRALRFARMFAGAILVPTVQHVPRHGRNGPFDWEFDFTTFASFPGITKPVPPSEFQ